MYTCNSMYICIYIYMHTYTQSGKSAHRPFENKSQWDAPHSGSHRSQCKIMQISMGLCAKKRHPFH